MAKKEKHPGGRPTKFSDEVMRIVEILAKRGLSDKVMSEVLGVTERTFNNWKKAHPEFFHGLADWKAEADDIIEKALYHRAKGYKCKDIKFATHEGMISDQVEYIKHYPPDTKAIELWLTNRRPQQWKVKAEIDVNQKVVTRIRKRFDGE